MPCVATAFDALVSVVLTAKVSTSTMAAVGAAVGDTMTVSFLADPAWVEREIVGQGVVYDGIGPFGICEDRFMLSFSSGMHASLTPPPPVIPGALPFNKDVASDGTLGLPKGSPDFWFSLMSKRPVNDGAFISKLADGRSAGVPLSVYGASSASPYNGVFDIHFARDTMPAITLKEAFGKYTKEHLLPGASTIHLTREWVGNVVLEADFESLSIGPAKDGVMPVLAEKPQIVTPTAAALKAGGHPGIVTHATSAASATTTLASDADSKCCWCDEDTPAAAKTITGPTDGKEYKLVFSDEFSNAGRTFANGDDTKWTALEVGDTSNQGTAFYLPGQATIAIDDEATGESGVSALMILTENVSHTGDSPTGEKGVKMPYRSAMLQTWDKFCFTGGIVEYRARQPRGAGYWPALWLFGNLGRAVYQNSNTGLWPWSYDHCDADLELPQTDPPQRISACDDHDYEKEGLHAFQGRGATELDVLEGAVTNSGKESYSVGSLQLSPGIPSYFKPPLFKYPNAEGPGKWYTHLTFGTGGTAETDGVANNGWYGPPWGSSCPTGCPDALSGGIVGLDDLDTRYWTYTMEWQTGADGYLKWYYDGAFVWGMDAASFGEYEVCEQRAGVKECHRTPSRMIPNEPMSLVMNTAIGTWNGGSSALDGQHWPAKFYVDHVRVWQNVEHIGCDPPDFPTKSYISKNAWMYGEPVKPSGYDTCPQTYPKSAYENAEKIKARGAEMKTKLALNAKANAKETAATTASTAAAASATTPAKAEKDAPAGFFYQSRMAATGLLMAEGGSSAASFSSTAPTGSTAVAGGMTALLVGGGFLMTLAAGYLVGKRSAVPPANGAWPLASVAIPEDGRDYEEFASRG